MAFRRYVGIRLKYTGDYYPTLMKCTGCGKEFAYVVVGYEGTVDEISLCFTCYFQRNGFIQNDNTKFMQRCLSPLKYTSKLMNSIDENSGLPFQFLWEIPYEDWSDDIKSRFVQPKPHSD